MNAREHRFAAVLAPGGIAAMEAALGEPLTFVSARRVDARTGDGRPLVRGGAARRVTEANRLEYVELLAEVLHTSDDVENKDLVS